MDLSSQVSANLRPNIVHAVTSEVIRETASAENKTYLNAMQKNLEADVASLLRDGRVERAMVKAGRGVIKSTAKSIVRQAEERVESRREHVFFVVLNVGEQSLFSAHFAFDAKEKAQQWGELQVGRSVADVFMGPSMDLPVAGDQVVSHFKIRPGSRPKRRNVTASVTMSESQRKNLFGEFYTTGGVWFTLAELKPAVEHRRDMIRAASEGVADPKTIDKVVDGIPEAIFSSSLVASANDTEAFIPGVSSVSELMDWFLQRLITPYWGAKIVSSACRVRMIRFPDVYQAAEAINKRLFDDTWEPGETPRSIQLVAMDSSAETHGHIRDMLFINLT